MTIQINQQNGIHLYVRSSSGQAQAGHCWIPLPDGGCPADLLPHVSRYLDVRDSYSHAQRNDLKFSVDAATWDAVRAEIAREAAKKAEERVRYTAAWRESAAQYLAGGDVKVSVCDRYTYCGSHPASIGGSLSSESTDVTAEEIAAVNAEHARREAAAEAKREEERQAKASALLAVLPRILAGEGAIGEYSSRTGWDYSCSTVVIDDIVHRCDAAGDDVRAQIVAEKRRRVAAEAAAEAAAIAALVATLDEATRARREAGFCTNGQWKELLNRAASAQLKAELESLGGVKCGGPAYVGGGETSSLSDEQYAVLAPVLAYAREHGIKVETMSAFDLSTENPCADHDEYDSDCSDCTVEYSGRRAIAKLSRVVGRVPNEGEVCATARIELGAY